MSMIDASSLAVWHHSAQGSPLTSSLHLWLQVGAELKQAFPLEVETEEVKLIEAVTAQRLSYTC